jgi:DNA-binding IclR family transcriptional regulator
VKEWSFLTNHACALVCIAHDPGVRLRDIAASLGITEGRAYAIVNDLAKAGYVIKERDGRRNRYNVQNHQPFRGAISGRTIGEVLDMLANTGPVAQHA